MKGLSFSAVGATVVSFILWFTSWAYWTYTSLLPFDSATYEAQKAIRYVFQGIGVLSTLTEYLAILLIGVGLIMAAKRLSKL